MSFVRTTVLLITSNVCNLRVIWYKSWLEDKPFRLSSEKYFPQTFQIISVLVQKTWDSTWRLEVHGTDRRPSDCCLRPETGGLKCTDKCICLRQAYGRLRPPPKHTVHCNNARTCDSGPRLPDKSWVKGLVVELETINWDRHVQCPARCSPLPAPHFPVVPSGLNNCSRVLVSRLSSGSPSDCDRVVCLPRNRGRIIAGHVWRGC